MAGGQGKAKASAGGSSRGRGKGRGNGSLTRGGRTNSNGRGPSTLGEAPPQNNTGGAKTSLQGGLANGRGELSLPSRLRSTGDNSGVRGVSSHDSRSTKSVTRTSSFPTSYPPSARATTSQPLQFQLPSQPRRQQQHQPQLQVQTRAPPQPQTQGQPQAQPPPEPQPNPEPEDDIYEELYPDEDLDVEDEFDEAVPEGQDYEQLLQNLMALPGRAHLTVLCEDPIPIGENTWKFNGPFFSWKVTPIHIRERWFRTLLRKYNWESGITEIVRSHFDWIVKKRLKGIVSQIKNRGIRPVWIVPTL